MINIFTSRYKNPNFSKQVTESRLFVLIISFYLSFNYSSFSLILTLKLKEFATVDFY